MTLAEEEYLTASVVATIAERAGISKSKITAVMERELGVLH